MLLIVDNGVNLYINIQLAMVSIILGIIGKDKRIAGKNNQKFLKYNVLIPNSILKPCKMVLKHNMYT